MKNIIIGTAGHVDHGKTALIKALTGHDADRLKEEKKRGITIELGFAYLDLPGGERAGIIDVPGHEKFVKNMLAGAGGIDLALLVVAADDGVMPQTREHLGIMNLLGIRSGFIVLTKTDLVEPEWLDMITDEIRGEVAGSFLEGAPVFRTSAHTGQGIDELRAAIFQQIESVTAKNTSEPFRLPVDRVFSVEGFGTVITGTLVEGTLSAGEQVEVYPAATPARVRNLQVHSRDVESAYAGQRVALNLAGLKKDGVDRGDCIAAPGSMQPTRMIDVRLALLPDSLRQLKNGSRLHFYHGASDCLCKLVLLETDEIGPGQEGYAQLRFTTPVAVKKGDRFVVRFYSPVETLGGGIILDTHPQKHRRKSPQVLESLRIRESGSTSENLLQAITEHSPRFTPLADIQRQLKLEDAVFQQDLNTLEQAGSVFRLSDTVAISEAYKRTLGRALQEILDAYHKANPLQAGMRRDELRSRLLPGREQALADRVLELFAADGSITLDKQKAARAGFEVQYSETDRKLADQMQALYQQAGYAPPAMDEVYALDPRHKANIDRVFQAMLADGALVMTDPQVVFSGAVLEDAKEQVRAYLTQHGEITLAQFRDLSGTSRKFALSLLEYFDRHGLTKKVGDVRVLARNTSAQ